MIIFDKSFLNNKFRKLEFQTFKYGLFSKDSLLRTIVAHFIIPYHDQKLR